MRKLIGGLVVIAMVIATILYTTREKPVEAPQAKTEITQTADASKATEAGDEFATDTTEAEKPKAVAVPTTVPAVKHDTCLSEAVVTAQNAVDAARRGASTPPPNIDVSCLSSGDKAKFIAMLKEARKQEIAGSCDENDCVFGTPTAPGCGPVCSLHTKELGKQGITFPATTTDPAPLVNKVKPSTRGVEQSEAEKTAAREEAIRQWKAELAEKKAKADEAARKAAEEAKAQPAAAPFAPPVPPEVSKLKGEALVCADLQTAVKVYDTQECRGYFAFRINQIGDKKTASDGSIATKIGVRVMCDMVQHELFKESTMIVRFPNELAFVEFDSWRRNAFGFGSYQNEWSLTTKNRRPGFPAVEYCVVTPQSEVYGDLFFGQETVKENTNSSGGSGSGSGSASSVGSAGRRGPDKHATFSRPQPGHQAEAEDVEPMRPRPGGPLPRPEIVHPNPPRPPTR